MSTQTTVWRRAVVLVPITLRLIVAAIATTVMCSDLLLTALGTSWGRRWWWEGTPFPRYLLQHFGIPGFLVIVATELGVLVPLLLFGRSPWRHGVGLGWAVGMTVIHASGTFTWLV